MASILRSVNNQSLVENFNFSWHNHDSLLVNAIQELYDEEYYCDCTLSADGVSIDCHRIVLSACSPFFHQIIHDHPGDRPVIIIDGLNKVELQAIVEFIYTGETSIPYSNLSDFFESCKFLQITGLKEYALVNDDTETTDTMIPLPEEISLSSLDLLEVKPELILDDFINESEFILSEDSPLPNDDLSGSKEMLTTANDDVDHSEMFSESFLELEVDPPDKLEQIGLVTENIALGEGILAVNCDDNKRYQCKTCGNKYTHRRTLLHHLHWICNQPATYACQYCPYLGKRKFQLTSHIKHVHSRNSLLKNHKLTK